MPAHPVVRHQDALTTCEHVDRTAVELEMASACTWLGKMVPNHMGPVVRVYGLAEFAKQAKSCCG